MTRRILLPLATVLCFLAPAPVAADMGAPLHFDFPPRVRFDNLDEYPDYVFYLQYRTDSSNPTRAPLNLVRVEPNQIIQFRRRLADVVLIAVPRCVVPAVEADRDDFCLAYMEGTHRVKIYDEIPFFAPDWDLCDYYIAPYRIAALHEDGSIELTRLPKVAVGRNVSRRMRIVLILASPALAILGIWWARRRWRSRRAKPSASSPPRESP